MRIAVHFPDGHPLAPEGPAVAAYKLGRIEDGVHNAPVGHAAVPLHEFLIGLLKEAQAEYPECEVKIERLIDNGDETSRWISADEFDPEKHTPVGAGASIAREIGVSASPADPGQTPPAPAAPSGAGA